MGIFLNSKGQNQWYYFLLAGNGDNYSKASLSWLEWIKHKQGISLQTALSNSGEYHVKTNGHTYHVDGYDKDSNTIYSYHGCFYHGHPKCIQDQTCKNPRTGQTMESLYARTMERHKHLKDAGYKVVVQWECEWNKRIKEDEEVSQFIHSLKIHDRLNIRDGLNGGRTNGIKLLHEVAPGEKIFYVDFTSLYPWVCKTCRFVTGHPKIITSNFDLTLQSYLGMVKCSMIPPRGLFIPVLPQVCNGKLMFPLCRTCAEKENQETCTCAESERILSGTWTTMEAQAALVRGYKIKEIHEVYHYEESSQFVKGVMDGPFSEFINFFLKIKQEASGYPAWVLEAEDFEEAKSIYIQSYKEKEGIQLNESNIAKNSGLRALAKLLLNR